MASEFLRQFGLQKILGNKLKKGLGSEPVRGDRLSGSAMMVPTLVWKEVGPLNDELPMYFEDLEISARIERSGRELWRVPEAVVTHAGELSAEVFPQRRMLLAMENGQAPWMYFNLYHGRVSASIFTLIIFIGSLFRLMVVRTVGWAALVRGGRGKAWRQRVIANSGALLGWSWGSKKEFLIKVQFRFYGGWEAVRQDLARTGENETIKKDAPA